MMDNNEKLPNIPPQISPKDYNYYPSDNMRVVEPRVTMGYNASPSDMRRNVSPAPGQQAIVLAALFIGLIFLGVQLWLLAVSLDNFLSGNQQDIWELPVISGLIFIGGLLALRMLRRVR